MPCFCRPGYNYGQSIVGLIFAAYGERIIAKDKCTEKAGNEEIALVKALFIAFI